MITGPSVAPLREPPASLRPARPLVSVIEFSPVLPEGHDCAAPHDARSSAASSRRAHAYKTPHSRGISQAMFGWKVAPRALAITAAALAVSLAAWPSLAGPSLRDMLFPNSQKS